MMSFKKSGLGDEKHRLSLIKNLSLLSKIKPKKLGKSLTHEVESLRLSGQPMDRFYLEHSPLFRFSRSEFLKNGGKFIPSILSSERSLSSANLLLNQIEYSPVESEIFYRAQQKDKDLSFWVKMCTSTFHEQNHRYLWRTLPAPQNLQKENIRIYLNFIESIVVTLDMVLSDSMGTNLSTLGYQLGVIYDPGTEIKFKNLREQMNYYHCACHATFLHLEGYNSKNSENFLNEKHAHLSKPLRQRAIKRAFKLDELFVHYTNPMWQSLHFKSVQTFLNQYPLERKTLNLSLSQGQMIEEYLLVEKVLSSFLKLPS